MDYSQQDCDTVLWHVVLHVNREPCVAVNGGILQYDTSIARQNCHSGHGNPPASVEARLITFSHLTVGANSLKQDGKNETAFLVYVAESSSTS